MLTDLIAQKILLRADLNTPLKNGNITDDTRLRAAVPTIEKLLAQGCGVAVCSHLGRPDPALNGTDNAKYSLRPVATALASLLGRAVRFVDDCTAVKNLQLGEVVLLENTRFEVGEKTNDAALAAQLVDGCDAVVIDAFGTAHRSHASTVGVTELLPSCAGLLLKRELAVLSGALAEPTRPLVVLVGGAKLDTKVGVLKNIVKIADTVLLGGGIANTFLAHAAGIDVRASLYGADDAATVSEVMRLAKESGCRVVLPTDAVVASDIDGSGARECGLDQLHAGDKIFDLGTASTVSYCEIIATAGTFVWNGPVGVFEVESFAAGTLGVARAATASAAQTICGGGDTIAAIARAGLAASEFTHISTGGGAMLQVLEGRELPVVAALAR